MRIAAVLTCALTCAAVCACSHGASSPSAASTPVSPAPVPPTKTNTPPVISKYTDAQPVVALVTPVTFEAVATDADNDPLVYTWTGNEFLASGAVVPQSAEGQTLTHVFESPGGFIVVQVHVTVTDGHGGTAQATTQAYVRGFAGRWTITRVVSGSFACFPNFVQPEVIAIQNGRELTGEYDPKEGCVRHGKTTLEAGTVDEAGNFSFRVKDATPRGDMFLKGTLGLGMYASATATYQGYSGFDSILLLHQGGPY